MKIILITDLHHRVSWVDDFLASEEASGADEVVFMGDYFDHFNDNEAISYKTAEWLVDRLRNPRTPKEIFLTGNHDMAYRYPSTIYSYCSGCTKNKSDAINSIMTPKDWDKLIMAYYAQDWLISHAGAHPYVFGPEMTPESIIEDCERAIIGLNENPKKWFIEFGAGIARGGHTGVGGITWLDFNKEFKAFPGINQLVAHTPQTYMSSVIGQCSINHDLDTHNKHVYTLVDGNLKVLVNKWLSASGKLSK